MPRRAEGGGTASARAATVLGACALLLAGCSTGTGAGGDSSTRDPAPASTAASGPLPTGTSPTGTPTGTGPTDPAEDDVEQEQPTAGADPTVLTEQDSGAQVALAVGEEKPLRLGRAWSWSEPVVDGAAVTLTPVDYLVDPGYVEWLLTGAAAGSATLAVVGEPACEDTTACPPTTVTLVVEVSG